MRFWRAAQILSSGGMTSAVWVPGLLALQMHCWSAAHGLCDGRTHAGVPCCGRSSDCE